MTELAIDTNATIDHVNARKEGPNDDKILALDVKCSGSVGYETLAPIIGAYRPREVFAAFWLDDEENTVRFPVIETIKVWAKIEFRECDVFFGSTQCRNVKVKKFSYRPRDGGVADLTFSVSIHDPHTGLFPTLAERLGESIPVRAESMQQSLDLAGEKIA